MDIKRPTTWSKIIMAPLNRRKLLTLAGGMAVVGVACGAPVAGTEPNVVTAEKGKSDLDTFELPPLPYDYNVLEPYIDTETMHLHHDKHHKAAVDKLNDALRGHPFAKLSIEEVMRRLKELPEPLQTAVRNNGGAHVNHTLFWEIMTPGGSTKPTGNLVGDIDNTFGSFDAFKTAFNDTGVKHFGSGWVWLVLNSSGNLQITSTANQGSPFTEGAFPVLGNDLWEHAYYLKYQNRRPEYLQAWWNVVNWDEVAKRYARALNTSKGG